MENIIVEEVCSITFQCGGWCCVSLKRGWHFANLLPGNQICQFIRGDQYMYLTSHENCYSWRCWLPLHNLSHCYCKTLVLGMVWSHNNTQACNMHINITGITTLVFLVLVKKIVAAEHHSQFCEMSLAWLSFEGSAGPQFLRISWSLAMAELSVESFALFMW